MARPNQEAINTFMSVTGVAEDVALQKIEVICGSDSHQLLIGGVDILRNLILIIIL